MKPLFRVKICGVTSVESVAACVSAGTDAIGLNCFKKSKRYLSPEAVPPIIAAIPNDVSRVGVFVNEDIAIVIQRAAAMKLDLIQLHGDEDADYAAQLEQRPYIRAFRFDERGFDPITAFLSDTVHAGCPPQAILIDAHVPGEFGGTGAVADWNRLAREKHFMGDTKMILAGGLTPQNVGQAIHDVSPHGVDTASGVESSPGEKAPVPTALFVKLARESFEKSGKAS